MWIKKIVKLCLMHLLLQLDYGNALYYGLPGSALSRLQRVQNTSARLVSRARKSTPFTPILMKLHWIPVRFRLIFKI